VDQVDALRAVMGGDVGAIGELDHLTLADTAASFGPLRLTRAALCGALTQLRSGRIAPTDAQRWASFMKRGSVIAGGYRLNIEWEDDDQFADVLMRMDELGDVINGTMSAAEIDQHIADLSRA
jgi:hypothetical protein